MLVMFQNLINLSRINKKSLMLFFDFFAVIGSLFAAFSIRLGYFYYPTGDNNLLLLMIASPILALPIFASFGMYREVIRYVGFKALWQINQAATLYAILWGLVSFMIDVEGIPRSVILINWLVVIIVIGSSRFFARWLLSESIINSGLFQKTDVVIYGAGSAGRQLSTALKESGDYRPVAFIDDASEV